MQYLPEPIQLPRSTTIVQFPFLFCLRDYLSYYTYLINFWLLKKQIYAFQAEALLKLHRHQEAYATFRKGPKFQIDSCTQFFGPAACAYMLIIQAQLYMTMGRLVEVFNIIKVLM